MWIPGEVCFNPDLTATDQRVFWLIKSFDRDDNHCFLSNGDMSELLNLSEQTISNSISTLIDFCYIEQREFMGQIRILIINDQFEDLYKDMLDNFDCAYKKIYREAIVRYKKIYSEQTKKLSTEKIKDINIKNLNPLSLSKERLVATPLSDDRQRAFQDYSKDAKYLFDFWNNLGKPLSKHKATPGILFNLAMDRMEGKLNSGYTVEQISGAMSRYHKMLSNPQNYLLIKSVIGHLVGLDHFFGFNEYTESKIYKINVCHGIKSWFDECVKGDDYLDRVYGRFMEDRHPLVTAKFRQLWAESEFDTYPLSPRDENCFRRAGMEFMKFIDARKNKIRFSRPEMEKPQLAVKYVFDAIRMDGAVDSKIMISTAWLCSRTTYLSRLPKYLFENSMMTTGD
jgi:hypothetical protein